MKEYHKLVALLNIPTTKGGHLRIIKEHTVELRYENASVFTKANARLRLYNMLDWLHESQICYCDADCVLLVYDKSNPNHRT